MNKYQTAAALIATAFISYQLGKRNAAAAVTAKAGAAAAAVDQAAWDWVNAVGAM